MARIYDIFQKVLANESSTVDRAMAAALPTADPLAARLLALSLLKRQHPEGAEALILRYHQLPADIQRAIVEHAAELFTPVRLAASRPATAGPDNMLTIVREAMVTRLAYLVVEQLRHGSETRRGQAGRCLRAMAQRCRTDADAGAEQATTGAHDAARVGPAAAVYLRDAVAEAVIGYTSHLSEDVLLALADLLPRSVPTAMRALAHPRHAALPVLRRRLAGAEDSALRRASFYLLSLSTLAQDVIAGLRHAAAAGELGEAMVGHAMLRLRAIREPLRRADPQNTPWPIDEQILAMPAHRARGLAPWAQALPAPLPRTTARLASLAQVEDPLARLAALRRLIDLSQTHRPGSSHAHRAPPAGPIGPDAPAGRSRADPSPGPPDGSESADTADGGDPGRAILDAIARFTKDPHPALARIALWHLIHARYPGLHRVLAGLINASDPRLRRIAGHRLGPIGFARLWKSWPRLGAAERRAAARAMLKIAPRFGDLLGEKLHAADRPTRLRALAMVHDLALGDRFEPIITDLAGGGDEVVASAAVKALGTADSASAAQHIERALDHRDSRVRANAVAAMSHHHAIRSVHRLADMAEHEDSRPRAGAIQALMAMKTPDALAALTRMLGDPREPHRASALWLTETIGLVELARHVGEMAVTDPAPAVRDRAEGVLHAMIQSLEQPLIPAGSSLAEDGAGDGGAEAGEAAAAHAPAAPASAPPEAAP